MTRFSTAVITVCSKQRMCMECSLAILARSQRFIVKCMHTQLVTDSHSASRTFQFRPFMAILNDLTSLLALLPNSKYVRYDESTIGSHKEKKTIVTNRLFTLNTSFYSYCDTISMRHTSKQWHFAQEMFSTLSGFCTLHHIMIFIILNQHSVTIIRKTRMEHAPTCIPNECWRRSKKNRNRGKRWEKNYFHPYFVCIWIHRNLFSWEKY